MCTAHIYCMHHRVQFISTSECLPADSGSPLQLLITRVEAARSLPVVQSSLDDALRQHQDRQQLPPPSCTPAQGASHNGVALPNLHVEAEFRRVLRCETTARYIT